ncbi:MAG: hypothetical protein ACXAEF_02860 [Candidatus Thorarchaeota archaeon]|jgi:hypothetical protein
MESEQDRSDERPDAYWMGVRDALRMVDSFLKWSDANKDRAKSLEDFLYDGLIADAKRCESCLHKKLGIEFSSEDDELPAEEPSFDSMPPTIETPSESSVEETEVTSSPPEIILEPEGSDDAADIPIEVQPDTSDDSIRIESMTATDDTLEEDSMVHGEPRDFSGDFSLPEPDSLSVTPDEDAIETPEPEKEEGETDTEDIVIDDQEDVVTPAPPSLPDEDEVTIERPKYAWESPSELSVEEPEAPPSAPEIPPLEETPDEPKVWSPMDDPSPDTLKDEDETESEGDNSEPPSPPPPPESEESEEERRRRARRLFFGA